MVFIPSIWTTTSIGQTWAGSAVDRCEPVTWNHALIAQSATPVLIACPNTQVPVGETVMLSVSGGRSPYTWYVTGGTGSISADSTTISAEYTAPDVASTVITAAVLDMYYTYDDQPLSAVE